MAAVTITLTQLTKATALTSHAGPPPSSMAPGLAGGGGGGREGGGGGGGSGGGGAAQPAITQPGATQENGKLEGKEPTIFSGD